MMNMHASLPCILPASQAVMKTVTWGFLLNGPMSYLRQSWNQLDFSILVLSITVLVMDIVGVSNDVLWLRALRGLR